MKRNRLHLDAEAIRKLGGYGADLSIDGRFVVIEIDFGSPDGAFYLYDSLKQLSREYEDSDEESRIEDIPF